MMSSPSASLRKIVSERAGHRCEYCLLPERFALHRHEPDHIVPLQHGGGTDEANLALACMRCNRFKGPNVGSFDPATGLLAPFFNPRAQAWIAHFQMNDGLIMPITPEARVTVKLLRLNDADRVLERRLMIEAGLY
jgi:hypothetical protein